MAGATRKRLKRLMNAQRTLRRPISCAGIGLHSGNKVTLSLKPAPSDFGIRFRRTDLGGVEIPATVHHLAGINYATGLSRDAGTVDTVVYLINEAGVKRLTSPRRYLKVLRPISLSRGDKRIALYPSEHFKVTYSIAF